MDTQKTFKVGPLKHSTYPSDVAKFNTFYTSTAHAEKDPKMTGS